VIADKDANPAFVASDLLSQAEHGVDSQVVLIAVDLTDAQLAAIEDELHRQAMELPRVDIVRGSIAHSVTVRVKTVDEAMEISNKYAPEHLILQLKDAESVVDKVMNAGSVFIGEWTPESVGDYSAGVNHSLRKFLLCVDFDSQSASINMISSNLRLRQAVLGREPRVLCQAYHQLELDGRWSPECWGGGDAVGEGRRARGPQEGCQHPAGTHESVIPISLLQPY
jgi:phosphoribosyl-ATP pyrophosphohydrolase/phosphoribosyl-AMP cyclohydrolase/histidinol dehydrogenase